MVAGDHCFCLTALSHRSSGRDSHCRCALGTLYTQMMVKRSFPTDMPLRTPQNQGHSFIHSFIHACGHSANTDPASLMSGRAPGAGHPGSVLGKRQIKAWTLLAIKTSRPFLPLSVPTPSLPGAQSCPESSPSAHSCP